MMNPAWPKRIDGGQDHEALRNGRQRDFQKHKFDNVFGQARMHPKMFWPACISEIRSVIGELSQPELSDRMNQISHYLIIGSADGGGRRSGLRTRLRQALDGEATLWQA